MKAPGIETPASGRSLIDSRVTDQRPGSAVLGQYIRSVSGYAHKPPTSLVRIPPIP